MRTLALLVLFAAASGVHSAVTVPAPPTDLPELVAPLDISNRTTYEIEMKTSLVIPGDKKVDEVRIWHALPTPRAWSSPGDGQKNGSAAQNISFFPANGAIEQRLDEKSNHVVWRRTKDLAPGTELDFTTHYTVHSAARSFNPQSVKLQWPVDFTPPEDINPSLAKMADRVRAAMSPTEAVQQFCTSIKNSITYDASVVYKPSDVDATVQNHRGHCGHIYNVFSQLCRRVGLPVRSVRGLNLNTPNGYGRLANVRADWTNIHTWAEVYFPSVGWVEVEPFKGKDAFSIPAQYVQNNQWFQNYVAQIFIDNKLQSIGWTPENGAFVSPYRVANLITFTATRQ
jgi:hypothetical protein